MVSGVKVTPDLEIRELGELDGLVELDRLVEVSRT